MKFSATTALLSTILLLAAGCGGSGGTTSSPGGKVFASAGCGGCHTLKAAGSKGQVGPNLDEAHPSFGTVQLMVTGGGAGMPSFKDRLSVQQIRDVAAFVATRAGSG
jgi:mono/diheme cytochrome c family protein